MSFDVAGVTGDQVFVQLNRLDYLTLAEVQVFGNAVAVPEPATLALWLGGLAALASRRRR